MVSPRGWPRPRRSPTSIGRQYAQRNRVGGRHTRQRQGLGYATGRINTYHLIRRVIVPDGITLTIGAGVTVLMHQAEYLNVFGNLHASGTAFSPIHFAPYVSGVNGYWAHIGIGGGSILTDSNQSQLRYVTLDSGGALDPACTSIRPRRCSII